MRHVLASIIVLVTGAAYAQSGGVPRLPNTKVIIPGSPMVKGEIYKLTKGELVLMRTGQLKVSRYPLAEGVKYFLDGDPADSEQIAAHKTAWVQLKDKSVIGLSVGKKVDVTPPLQLFDLNVGDEGFISCPRTVQEERLRAVVKDVLGLNKMVVSFGCGNRRAPVEVLVEGVKADGFMSGKEWKVDGKFKVADIDRTGFKERYILNPCK